MGKYTAYQVALKQMVPGTHKFAYKLDKQFFSDMESADIRDADIDVALSVTYAHDVYCLDFACTGTVTVPCDRCLDDLQLPVEAGYKVTVKYGDTYRDDSDEVLEIPESAQTLNVAYMIYDTVSLAIPLKHVHPLGKCNRQMSAMLKKHRAAPAGEDAELENQLIEEADYAGYQDNAATDPRWDALKGLADDTND